jgi:ATP-dependent DNA helicase HFM1/MER3
VSADIQTLAVGVNLPAHLVIIKGTATWNGAAAGFREYSDIDIQQMMGRAGRIQYDNTGTVVVMCSRDKVPKVWELPRLPTDLVSIAPCCTRRLSWRAVCKWCSTSYQPSC